MDQNEKKDIIQQQDIMSKDIVTSHPNEALSPREGAQSSRSQLPVVNTYSRNKQISGVQKLHTLETPSKEKVKAFCEQSEPREDMIFEARKGSNTRLRDADSGEYLKELGENQGGFYSGAYQMPQVSEHIQASQYLPQQLMKQKQTDVDSVDQLEISGTVSHITDRTHSLSRNRSAVKAIHSQETRSNNNLVEKVGGFYDTRGARTGHLSSEGLEGSEDLLFQKKKSDAKGSLQFNQTFSHFPPDPHRYISAESPSLVRDQPYHINLEAKANRSSVMHQLSQS